MSGKHWSKAKIERLKAMWPKHSRKDIEKEFAPRSWRSISQKAFDLKLRRHARTRTRVSTKDHLMASLRNLREQNGLSCRAVSKHIDVSRVYISRCERGEGYPRLPKLIRWCAFFGQELTIKPVRAA
jgi:DNA-binding XRE family transcriptional regulator